MKNRTNILKVNTIVLLIFVVLTLYSRSFPQDFSDGEIDFIFKPENNWTQFVIWLEDENGDYAGTAFITNFIGRRGGGNRTDGTNIDSPAGNRLSAFPIWAHKRGVIDTTYGIENNYPPAANKPAYPQEIDAVSGATPGPGIQTMTKHLSGLAYGEYNCFIEVNRSYDFNSYHDYSFYRGQPSLVWKTTINVNGSADSSMVLDYFGYGSTDGSDGLINPPDSTITTAADLLRDIGEFKFNVLYNPGSVSVQEESAGSSLDNFSLNQNYPNPFNPVTVISYFLPQSGHVNLAVYNIYGQRVAVLVDQQETAGYKRISWDGKDSKGLDVSNGIYLYKLQTCEHTGIKTMVFLK